MNTTIAKEQDISPQLQAHKLFGSLKKKRQLLALLLFALTLLVYKPATGFQFVNYDDPQYVTKNLTVQQGLHWHTLGWACTTFEFYNWHPLTWITFLMDYQFFKLNPAGYHFMNVLYHALAAILLFLVLQRGTGHLGRSFCVALLFALHPLNIESVAWVSERKNTLSAIFWFLAIWAYGWYALRPGWKRYLTVAACFALGLMAKATVITLPFVFLLLDLWPLRRVKSFSYQPGEDFKTGLNFVQKNWPELVLEKIPLFLVSAVSAVVTLRALKGLSTPISPAGVRVENAIVAYVLYLYKAFLPRHLAVFYPLPSRYFPAWELAACAILLVVITIAVLHLRRRQPYLLVGWLWFLGTLAPVIRVFQAGDEGMADRYVYLPLVGVFFAVVWAVADWTLKLPNRSYWLGAIGMLLFVALYADFRAQLPVWENSLALWSHAVQVDDNYMSETKYGESLEQAGRGSDGLARYALAVARDPDRILSHFNYGWSLLRNHQPEKAISEFQKVLSAWEGYPGMAYIVMQSHFRMGLAYSQLGNTQAAEDELKQTIQMDPSQDEAFLQLGMLYQRQNRCREAMAPLAISLQTRLSNAGLLSKGICLEQQGKLQEACATFQQALQIFPGYEPAQTRLQEVEDLLAGKNTHAKWGHE